MKSSIPRSELDRLWSDPANWTSLGTYRCEADPRTWVLKRSPGIGYTINVAHGRSWLGLLGVVVLAVAPTVVRLTMGRRTPPWWILVELLVPIAVVVVLLVWVSRRDSR
ncbi:MAG TPA: DUF5808 domain-containing protein [Gemmatimonadaceae bacterium]|nr:DUF5808 domain-containing protein [Gemmatimonadaceae bacterium]